MSTTHEPQDFAVRTQMEELLYGGHSIPPHLRMYLNELDRFAAAHVCPLSDEEIRFIAASHARYVGARRTITCTSVQHSDVPEHVNEVLAVVESYGPYGLDINEGLRFQIVLADEVKRVRALLPLARPWISVFEHLPPFETFVLAHNGKWTGVAKFASGAELDDSERWQDEHSEFIEHLGPAVTHWMPLPMLPAAKETSASLARGKA
ncbi:DUF551 domain-containing protein [Paraburkholderia sp. J11-2]|uniref:DUF551 domain-containing protein n=1 Tax=Paraburkholderia sp. J11-2 TaxID=2805431 RepID=UPI002AB70332|nr:DUF551 domain-containing protein [Paraburkholderia sp. J11-2]